MILADVINIIPDRLNKEFKIIHLYKGKKVSELFYLENKHLFKDPYPVVLDSAIEMTVRLKEKTPSIFIDEFGKVTLLDPESFD
jgi:hypothetical protein